MRCARAIARLKRPGLLHETNKIAMKVLINTYMKNDIINVNEVIDIKVC